LWCKTRVNANSEKISNGTFIAYQKENKKRFNGREIGLSWLLNGNIPQKPVVPVGRSVLVDKILGSYGNKRSKTTPV
jgi:hypothetical protein